MTKNIRAQKKPDDEKSGQLTVFKVLAFVGTLVVAGGLMFAAGAMFGHSPHGTATTPH